MLNEVTNIPDVIRRQAGVRPTADALVDDASRITFAELSAAMLDVARGLMSLGIGPGDRVALWAPNSADWIVAFLGTLATGAAAVPVNTRFKGEEAAYILGRSGARAVITASEFNGTAYVSMLRAAGASPDLTTILLPGSARVDETIAWEDLLAGGESTPAATAGRRLEEVDGSCVAYVSFTSGTTGRPKGALVTHGQSLTLARTMIAHMGMTERDRVLAVIPLFHVFGLNIGFLVPAMTGAGSVLASVFEPRSFMATIEREAVALIPGPPTIFEAILAAPDRSDFDLGSLRLALISTTDLPRALVLRLLEESVVESVITAYGLTEALVVSCSRPGDDPELVASFAGRVLDGVEVRVINADGSPAAPGEQGELHVRSEMVTGGYLNDVEATQAAFDADGWLYTGDLGIVTAEGWVRITGRTKDIFIVGGFNAYPAEIEEMLREHPDIRDAAVVGMPDARLGEVGAAFVVLRDGAEVAAESITAWARERMANYKVPRLVELVEAIPKNATMKVDKTELRRRAADLVQVSR